MLSCQVYAPVQSGRDTMRIRSNQAEPKSLAEVRNRLADVSLVILATLGLVAILLSLYRIREFGWLNTMTVHVTIYVLVLLLFLARKKISYRIKSGFLLLLIFILGSMSFPSLATAGSGVFFYLALVVLGTLFYGFRGGMASIVVCTVVLFGAMAATRAGRISPEVDLNAYAMSTSSWAAKIAAFLLLGGLCLGLMTLMQLWLTRAIRDMEEEINERQAAERMLEDSVSEKEILLKEVHHRVKSNLQAISGLLDLHLLGRLDEDARRAIRDSQARIRVMAQVHEELYGSEDLANIDLAEFLSKLTHNLFSSFGVDEKRIGINLDLEPIYLPTDTVIPCGLVANELVTNILKHAFPNGRSGTVNIRLSREEDEKYRLVVSDDGVGMAEPVESPGSGTLGIMLIRAISDQLDAEISWSVSNGVTFEMLFMEYREAGTELY